MSFPYEINKLNDEDNKCLLRDFLCEPDCWWQVGPKKYLFPYNYLKVGPQLYNFKVRPDDVWVITYPRSGTTLMQEMTYLLNTDLDYEAASKVPQVQRFPQFEQNVVVSDHVIACARAATKGDPVNEALCEQLAMEVLPQMEKNPKQRFFKCHVPISLLPPNLLDVSKVVYVCRHPKDSAVSYFHLSCTLINFQYQNDFEHFWDYFERGLIRCTPYWEHVKEAWEKRDHPNMLFLFYEDIIKDMKGTIRKVANHYGKHVTEEQINQLANHMHIDNFRKNKAVNMDMLPFTKVQHPNAAAFVRDGKTGSWKDYFTPELNARADKWITENMARIPGFTFPSPK